MDQIIWLKVIRGSSPEALLQPSGIGIGGNAKIDNFPGNMFD